MDETIQEYIARMTQGTSDFSEVQRNVLYDDLRVASIGADNLRAQLRQAQAEAEYYAALYRSTQAIAG